MYAVIRYLDRRNDGFGFVINGVSGPFEESELRKKFSPSEGWEIRELQVGVGQPGFEIAGDALPSDTSLVAWEFLPLENLLP